MRVAFDLTSPAEFFQSEAQVVEDRMESAGRNFAGGVTGDNGTHIGAGSPPDFVATPGLAEEFTALFA
jgi:hypothetical protein